MKKLHLVLTFLVFLSIQSSFGFCGFYVAKADTKLFNKTSQVIIARDGLKTVVTMSNDYTGPIDDFAMVVPVPEVLTKDKIKTVNKSVFDKLDAYSAPRMAEYYDPNPCWVIKDELVEESAYAFTPSSIAETKSMQRNEKFNVRIEAKYTVGKYDILILSAKESNGLEKWLTLNNYKIPKGASEVLEPYIKSGMKFFVAKVNLNELKKSGSKELHPIRITYNSEKYMLPIRLGMANANGDQDMVVYLFSKKGRVETTNYRTVKIPTNNNIPTFVKSKFGKFYKDTFEKVYKREQGKTVFLEYAWDVSSRNYVKCDPCVGTPPANPDLVNAGVWWINNQPNSNVFFTRLHVRYNRKNFPQDLMFQTTGNTERFQGRYVVHNRAQGNLDCESAKPYLEKLIKRRGQELIELNRLTGWSIAENESYIQEVKDLYNKNFKTTKDDHKDGNILPVYPGNNDDSNNLMKYLFLSLIILLILTVVLRPSMQINKTN